MHDEVAGKADSRIDLNRAGTPLLEIVSEPDHALARRGQGVSDRVETLVELSGRFRLQHAGGEPPRGRQHQSASSTRPRAKSATPIVEVKNMNSFRAVERALTYEAERQWQDLAGDGPSTSGRRAQARRAAGTRTLARRRTAATFQGRVERLSLFPRSGSRAGDGDRCEQVQQVRERRWANCRPPCARGWSTTYGITPYDSRRAGEPGTRAWSTTTSS